MHKRTKELRDLMSRRELTSANVGKLLGRSATTVDIWRCQTDESRVIPANTLKLLSLLTAKAKG